MRRRANAQCPSNWQLAESVTPTQLQAGLGENGQCGLWKGSFVLLQKLSDLVDSLLQHPDLTDWSDILQKQLDETRHVQHPNICQIFGIVSKGNETVIVTELMYQTLQHRLTLGPLLSEQNQLYITQCVASAISYLHNQPQPIIYHSLTSKRVYVSRDVLQVKLMGVAVARTISLFPRTKSTMPAQFMIVEVDSSLQPKFGADISALGVITAQVLLGKVECQQLSISGSSSLQSPAVTHLKENLETISYHPFFPLIVSSLGEEVDQLSANNFVELALNELTKRSKRGFMEPQNLDERTKMGTTLPASSSESVLTRLASEMRCLRLTVSQLEDKERK